MLFRSPAPASVVLADAGAPAVLALAPLTVMRAFVPRLRRPGPLFPPLSLRLHPSPPLPACRFPLAPALSALAPLLAMPTRALSPASAPTTQADGLADARRGAMPSLGGRWSARGTSRVGGTAGLCVLPFLSAQPQTRARRRRLSTLWSHSTLMGQATRELAQGLRSAA